MKIHLLTITFSIISFSLQAQLPYLRLSPLQKMEQIIGTTTVKLEFSRPQIKGRTIFGGIVPYGKMWRTGANENTKITFNHRVKIGGQEVKAGTYAIFTKPNKTDWEFFLYKDINNLNVPNPIDTSKIVVHIKVPSKQLPSKEETLVINFYDVTEYTANLGISWEKTFVKVPIECYTQEAMESKINQMIKQNALDFSIAASYYLERGIELEKAKKYQALSIEMGTQPSSWAYNSYAKILYKLDEKDAAKKALELSLKLAKQEKNEYLIKENEKLLKEWKLN